MAGARGVAITVRAATQLTEIETDSSYLSICVAFLTFLVPLTCSSIRRQPRASVQLAPTGMLKEQSETAIKRQAEGLEEMTADRLSGSNRPQWHEMKNHSDYGPYPSTAGQRHRLLS